MSNGFALDGTDGFLGTPLPRRALELEILAATAAFMPL